jgi:hypothetical protein
LPPSLFSSLEKSFHLPIYADAMAHASIIDLATWDEGFIGSCSSSFRSSSITCGISLY